MATYTEAYRPYEFLLSEAEGTLSRESITLASGAGSLVSGSVLGEKTVVQAAAPIPTIVGTGSGVMSALKFGPDVQVGSYVVTLTATSATAAFTVTAPDGTALPNGAVGTAYKSSHLSFSIANGGTMTSGDAYTVVVTAGGTPVLVGTGSGTVSGVTLGKNAKLATYRIELKATSATAEFQVSDPDGALIGYGKVATAYTSDHVNFTLANGGTMTIGDYFNIVVANQSAVTGYYYLCDPAAVDGTQNPAGILGSAADASSSTATATAIVRLAAIKTDVLTWKSTVTAAQKAALLNKLAVTKQIVARS